MTTLADDLPQFGAERRQVRDLQGQDMPNETFAIGELSRAASTKVETVRWYEPHRPGWTATIKIIAPSTWSA
jgi:hypothetical protein